MAHSLDLLHDRGVQEVVLERKGGRGEVGGPAGGRLPRLARGPQLRVPEAEDALLVRGRRRLGLLRARQPRVQGRVPDPAPCVQLLDGRRLLQRALLKDW